MKSIQVEKAVGMILCHDITRIVPDVFKGPAFKKGHVITKDDIEPLLNLGKRYIYVADFDGRIHENDAAARIARAACGTGLRLTEPNEGKITVIADKTGLLKVNIKALEKINSIPDIMLATLHTDQVANQDQDVAGTRIIPLSIEEEPLAKVETICRHLFPVIEIKPMTPVKVGMVVTGSEVYNHRIEDGFGPVVKTKFESLGCRVFNKILVSDQLEMTVNAISRLLDEGAGMIAVTGGMSVDPDDRTPSAIRAAGGKVTTYGAPVLPGAMFMLAHIGTIPVVGLPGCVMYHKASIFDLVIPRLLAGEEVTPEKIATMGHGGYCSSCKSCRYPVCGFGKG